MNKHLKRVLLGSAVIGLAVACGLGTYYRYYYIKHFRVVDEGALYRSGQPDKRDLERLRDAYGVRSIVNLRRVDEQNEDEGLSFDQERAEVERLGLRFFHLPMDGDADVDPDMVSRWLAIARAPDNYPILIHCKAGVDRTGLLTAVYRIKVQGWPPNKALDEAKAEGIDATRDRNLVRFIQETSPSG